MPPGPGTTPRKPFLPAPARSMTADDPQSRVEKRVVDSLKGIVKKS